MIYLIWFYGFVVTLSAYTIKTREGGLDDLFANTVLSLFWFIVVPARALTKIL